MSIADSPLKILWNAVPEKREPAGKEVFSWRFTLFLMEQSFNSLDSYHRNRKAEKLEPLNWKIRGF